ncbi:MAG: hypothetical protein BGO14_05750 [Chlamydiales bacterium 38-26]|nr:hypothetical protein [Chlamydiales bacterium]OJV08401.1 MAG: hypothetical protein BGO14_05750 [Chlamydiales bacterium 38-26]
MTSVGEKHTIQLLDIFFKPLNQTKTQDSSVALFNEQIKCFKEIIQRHQRQDPEMVRHWKKIISHIIQTDYSSMQAECIFNLFESNYGEEKQREIRIERINHRLGLLGKEDESSTQEIPLEGRVEKIFEQILLELQWIGHSHEGQDYPLEKFFINSLLLSVPKDAIHLQIKVAQTICEIWDSLLTEGSCLEILENLSMISLMKVEEKAFCFLLEQKMGRSHQDKVRLFLINHHYSRLQLHLNSKPKSVRKDLDHLVHHLAFLCQDRKDIQDPLSDLYLKIVKLPLNEEDRKFLVQHMVNWDPHLSVVESFFTCFQKLEQSLEEEILNVRTPFYHALEQIIELQHQGKISQKLYQNIYQKLVMLPNLDTKGLKVFSPSESFKLQYERLYFQYKELTQEHWACLIDQMREYVIQFGRGDFSEVDWKNLCGAVFHIAEKNELVRKQMLDLIKGAKEPVGGWIPFIKRVVEDSRYLFIDADAAWKADRYKTFLQKFLKNVHDVLKETLPNIEEENSEVLMHLIKESDYPNSRSLRLYYQQFIKLLRSAVEEESFKKTLNDLFLLGEGQGPALVRTIKKICEVYFTCSFSKDLIPQFMDRICKSRKFMKEVPLDYSDFESLRSLVVHASSKETAPWSHLLLGSSDGLMKGKFPEKIFTLTLKDRRVVSVLKITTPTISNVYSKNKVESIFQTAFLGHQGLFINLQESRKTWMGAGGSNTAVLMQNNHTKTNLFFVTLKTDDEMNEENGLDPILSFKNWLIGKGNKPGGYLFPTQWLNNPQIIRLLRKAFDDVHCIYFHQKTYLDNSEKLIFEKLYQVHLSLYLTHLTNANYLSVNGDYTPQRSIVFLGILAKILLILLNKENQALSQEVNSPSSLAFLHMWLHSEPLMLSKRPMNEENYQVLTKVLKHLDQPKVRQLIKDNVEKFNVVDFKFF